MTAGSTPCWNMNVNRVSSNGVRMRLVNSSPWIGTMVIVGRSDMLPPNDSPSVSAPGCTNVLLSPALATNSKVAATLETPVKCCGR